MERMPDAVVIDAPDEIRGVMAAQVKINDLLGAKLKEILGEAVLGLYKESRATIPGVELAIYKGNLPTGEHSILAKVIFRKEVIARQQYIITVQT